MKQRDEQVFAAQFLVAVSSKQIIINNCWL